MICRCRLVVATLVWYAGVLLERGEKPKDRGMLSVRKVWIKLPPLRTDTTLVLLHIVGQSGELSSTHACRLDFISCTPTSISPSLHRAAHNIARLTSCQTGIWMALKLENSSQSCAHDILPRVRKVFAANAWRIQSKHPAPYYRRAAGVLWCSY